ncbi:M20/M25/M40 family metallo-hydrolase [bacterium]|nr:M20/M25/M40 family metallo-hydrolase [bacterium]MCI0601709.1 M20/M25/M40 family metallo-hydrolase [bacterium]
MKKAICCLMLGLAVFAQSAEEVDLSVVHQIKKESFQNGKVMDHMFSLTDLNGPRLSGSPEYKSAADWAVGKLKEWGITSAGLESWGKFGRGWSLKKFEAHIVQPFYTPISGFPHAWSEGTAGRIKAEVVYAPVFFPWEDDMRRDPSKVIERVKQYAQKNKGKFRGKIVLTDPRRSHDQPTASPSERYDEEDLSSVSEHEQPYPFDAIQWPITSLPEDPKERDRFMDSLPLEIEADFWEQQQKALDTLIIFLREEGAVANFTMSSRGIGGTFYAIEAGSHKATSPASIASIAVQREQYGRIVRLVEKNIPVVVEMEMNVDFPPEEVEGWNVIAEIPGGSKKQEVVILGAHLDSWHSGTGATDNAAGCAVVLEAMRVLKTLNLKMDRTVRMGLWGGEEQALYGSRGYVAKHFADPVTMKLHPEHAKISGYFNLDNGTGRIRGIYLQGNDMTRPIFKEWFEPFADLKAETITIRNTSGTDHLSFDAVGIPGFQFIQDPLEYDERTHHSNIDVYDHIEPADLMQASAIMATFVYNTSTRPELLPRKPLPKPLPPKKQ